MPGVAYRPVANHGGVAVGPIGIVVHHAVSGLAACEARFNDPNAQSSAHFFVEYDGTVTQFVDVDVVAYHACQANYTGWVGVEHESPTTGDLFPPLTDMQVAGTGRILRWLHETYGVPLIVSDHVGAPGVAYHSMVPGPCETAWGVTGCPGAAIVGQRQQIVDAAGAALTGGSDVYVLYNPDKSQAVLVGDTQVDGFVPAQLANVGAAVQVTARTQAEFDATLNKRKPVVVPPITASGTPNTGFTGTINLTPKT